MEKKCTVCKEVFDLGEGFNKNKNTVDGHGTRCRLCDHHMYICKRDNVPLTHNRLGVYIIKPPKPVHVKRPTQVYQKYVPLKKAPPEVKTLPAGSVIPPDYKLCPKCKIIKEKESGFCKKWSTKDGFAWLCKMCVHIYPDRTYEARMLKRKEQPVIRNVSIVTQALLHELFTYHPETGDITSNATGESVVFAGTTGYTVVYVVPARTHILTHRVIWMYLYGHFPEFIDHIDGMRSNNRLSNLRECNRRENGINTVLHREGKLPGGNMLPNGLWVSNIRTDTGLLCLGRKFTTLREASLVYCSYVLKHGLVRREFIPATFTDEELFS